MICFTNVRGISDFPCEIAANFNLGTVQDRNGQVKYCGVYRGLRITVWISGKYHIRGSIWKYYLGNNHSAFTWLDFQNAVNELDSLTYGTFSKAKLIKFEFGLNIHTIHNPQVYLQTIKGIKINNRLRLFYPNYDHKKLWGISTQELFSRYKVYDKSFVDKIKTSHILRIENVILNAKRVFKKEILLSDLLCSRMQLFLVNSLQGAIDNFHSYPFPPQNYSTSARDIYMMILISSGMSLDRIIMHMRERFSNKCTLDQELVKIRKMYRKHTIKSPLLNELQARSSESLGIYSIYQSQEI